MVWWWKGGSSPGDGGIEVEEEEDRSVSAAVEGVISRFRFGKPLVVVEEGSKGVFDAGWVDGTTSGVTAAKGGCSVSTIEVTEKGTVCKERVVVVSEPTECSSQLFGSCFGRLGIKDGICLGKFW